MLIMLTDGQHNAYGREQIVSREQIALKALNAMKNDCPIKICGLGFGVDADFDLMKELSSKTGGIARRIYADSDAALQLRNFYEEISSPLLGNVNIKYVASNALA